MRHGVDLARRTVNAMGRGVNLAWRTVKVIAHRAHLPVKTPKTAAYRASLTGESIQSYREPARDIDLRIRTLLGGRIHHPELRAVIHG